MIADTVLTNGGIYTVTEDHGWAEAAAIRGGIIIAVGDNEEIEQYTGRTTRIIDLQGRMALPGLHDSHIHPLEGGYLSRQCDVSTIDTNIDDVIAAFHECENRLGGDWFVGSGLNLALFGLTGPDKSILDGIAPGRYIFIDASDGHAALVNDRALELVGFNAETPDPVGGVIERREVSNEPSGTVRETARDMIAMLLPEREFEESLAAMAEVVGTLNSVGVTSIVDAWSGELEMSIYKALDQSGDLTVRVVNSIIDEGVFAKHTGEDFERVLAERQDFASDRIDSDSIKLMIDGVFEGEMGALIGNYQSADHDGVLNHSPAELRERVLRYELMNLQIHMHTMGDRAVRAGLDAIEYARKHNPSPEAGRNLRHTLSHLGLIHPDDIPRFAELNVVANFTPLWAYADEWQVNLEVPTLGVERVKRLYPIRSVHESGGVIVTGTDWTYGGLEPMASIEVGVTRKNPYGPSVFISETSEAVDLATMIDSYTINGAWLAHREDVVGSIEVGKRADLVILDRNLFEISPSEISDALVDMTIFDGDIVYDRMVNTQTSLSGRIN